MNVVLQVFVFTTVLAVGLCAVPHEKAALELVTKLHKLHQAGLVPEDVVTTSCTVAGPFLLGCQATPAEPACTAAGAACAVYSAGRWAWDKVHQIWG